MSADGAGIIGAAVLGLSVAPILIAGATIAGAVYGTAKLIEYTSNNIQKSEAIRREQERQKAVELAKKTEKERQQINEVISLFNGLQSRQADTRKKLNQRFAAELSLAASEMERKQQLANINMVELVKGFEEKSANIFLNWKQSSEQLQSTYSSSINNSIFNMKQTVEDGNRVITAMQKQILDDSAKEQYAKDQIEKAKIALDALVLEIGNSSNGLVNNLNQAIAYYNQGLFENAYSVASAVEMNCYDDLGKSLVEKEKMHSLLDMLEARLILEKSKIESLKHFTFNYKDDSYEEDLTRFSPEIFSAISARLSNIENHLSVHDLASLISLSSELDEIEIDIIEITKLSATKLLFAYTENDTATDITSAMKSQGFDMEGYAYEKDVEGNSIHINYVNRISNEKVTVVLTPSQEGLKIDVHNYGTSSITGQEDVTRQDSIRQLIENTLNIRISCTNRGKASTNTNAANLDEVKRLN